MGIHAQKAKAPTVMQELHSKTTTKERKREIVNDIARQEVSRTVNDGTRCLKEIQDADRSWSTDRAAIKGQAKTTFREMERTADRLMKLPGANKKDIQAILGSGSKIFLGNAKTAYKDTLYMHEKFDEEKFLMKATEGIGSDILMSGLVGAGAVIAVPGMPLGSIAVFGGKAGLEMVGNVLAEVGGPILKGAGAVGLAVTIGMSVYQAGDFIYMKTTLPEMETMPTE